MRFVFSPLLTGRLARNDGRQRCRRLQVRYRCGDTEIQAEIVTGAGGKYAGCRCQIDGGQDSVVGDLDQLGIGDDGDVGGRYHTEQEVDVFRDDCFTISDSAVGGGSARVEPGGGDLVVVRRCGSGSHQRKCREHRQQDEGHLTRQDFCFFHSFTPCPLWALFKDRGLLLVL